MSLTLILGLARGLYYGATMVLFGGAAFGAVLRRRLPQAAPMPGVYWTALTVAIAAAIAWLALAANQMAGAMDSALVVRTAKDTLFGQMFVARMAALLGLALLPAAWRRDWPAILLAGLALGLPAFTSHAAGASPAGFLAIGAAIDALHLLTAGFWIGGLSVLVFLFLRREPAIATALALFSDAALIAVLLLVMTGLINIASVVLGGAGKTSMLYLTVLAAKLVLVAAMLVLAALNRLRLMPKRQTASLARNVRLELGLGVCVLLLAGLLGQLAPKL